MYFWMNVGYTCSNIISIVLMILSYRSDRFLPLVTPAMFILNMKYIVRCLDLEESRSTMTTDEWESLLVQNIIVII